MLSGEPLSQADVALFDSMTPKGAVLVNSYGSMEATLICNYDHVNGDIVREGDLPAGDPVEGMNVYVFDADGQDLPVGEIGEITVR